MKDDIDFLLKNPERHVIVFKLTMKLINSFDCSNILVSSNFRLRWKISAIDLLQKIPLIFELFKLIDGFGKKLLHLDFVQIALNLI